MRGTCISGLQPMFESLENRVLLSASVHHAATHHDTHAKPAAIHAIAKKPSVKASAATGGGNVKGDPIFMKFGGITGEVTANGYAGDIELNSFQWGVSRTIASPTGGSSDRESSAPAVSEITITKTMDKTSPLLLQGALVGQSTKEVDIFFVGPTGGVSIGKPAASRTYAEYVLSNVMISGYSVSSGGDRPTETLTLNFTKIQFNYIPNGAAAPISTVYDLSNAQIA